jgi:hypothetical protein
MLSSLRSVSGFINETLLTERDLAEYTNRERCSEQASQVYSWCQQSSAPESVLEVSRWPVVTDLFATYETKHRVDRLPACH